jgi:hypothetical protein
MVCEAYADDQGTYPVWSSSFESLTSLYICLLIVTREPGTTQGQYTTTSSVDARTISFENLCFSVEVPKLHGEPYGIQLG